MIGTLEENIIQYGGPTLAGLKTGSLFSCLRSQFPQIERQAAELDEILKHRGLRLRIMADKGHYVLIYLWQETLLETLLVKPETQAFLTAGDYHGTLSEVLQQLVQRLQGSVFPHEIGLFLDYPLEDVRDYIRHEGKDCLSVGLWKVYHNPDSARKRMDSFRQCAEILLQHFYQGQPLMQLIVSR